MYNSKIAINKRVYSLGTYATEGEAQQAYKIAVELFNNGDFSIYEDERIETIKEIMNERK